MRWGARAGLLYATFLSAFVLIAYLTTGGQSIASVGLSLPVVLLFYAAAGLLGGVVLGLCRPLLRAIGGAMLSGFLVLLPAAAMIVLLLRPEWSIQRMATGTVLFAACAGPLWAAGMFYGARLSDRWLR